jgi:hypothetical protein
MLTKMIFILLLFSTNVLAGYSEIQSQSCRDASIRYKSLSVWADTDLIKIIKNGLKIQEIKAHTALEEAYKDKEYKELIEIEEGYIAKGTDRITADTWRIYMEAGIDFALALPYEAGGLIAKASVDTPSIPSDFSTLGKSEDYYQRKIYDLCMHN